MVVGGAKVEAPSSDFRIQCAMNISKWIALCCMRVQRDLPLVKRDTYIIHVFYYGGEGFAGLIRRWFLKDLKCLRFNYLQTQSTHTPSSELVSGSSSSIMPVAWILFGILVAPSLLRAPWLSRISCRAPATDRGVNAVDGG